MFPELAHHQVRGRLVDLIKVTQRKHNLAVTVALGRNMDAIVVDDD
jgi:structural maintenance of chromosome 1